MDFKQNKILSFSYTERRETLLIAQLKPPIVLLYFIMSQIKTYVLKIVSLFICQMYLFCNNET
ncbi:hypothetical protein AXF35_00395 [Legionella pneumophila subsp. pascullei]|nr:hypothetical protein AXF35_00395 [Legionella pneumophila subsp. pascullei]AMP91153.1 hypothetical protein AXF36_00395 [Legionella pneumophila subsp. pascullei]AMP94140.1 hypothetical protein AXF37_00395 [Legionella pneumophila subsp. pascullei]